MNILIAQSNTETLNGAAYAEQHPQHRQGVMEKIFGSSVFGVFLILLFIIIFIRVIYLARKDKPPSGK